MNIFKRFVSGLGQQTAPFGFAPEDPNASYQAGLSYIGDIGANLMANNQGGVDPWANLGASIQQAKQSSRDRSKDTYTAQRLMEEAALKREERDRETADRKRREDYMNTLPPDVRMKAMSIPGYLDSWISANDPDLQKPEKPQLFEVGDALVSEDGTVVYQGSGSVDKAPVVKTIYDPETGQEQAVQWDGMEWVPLGGKKAKGDKRSSATELKELWSSEDEIPALDSTLDSLQTALDLNKKTFTGYTAGVRGWAGTALPGAGMLIDPEAAKATREFNQIMSMEAIKSMASTLKGATTDRELAQFVEILADPSTPPDIRERTITRMISLAEKQRQLKTQRVRELRGNQALPAAPVVTEDGYTIEPVE